jgi:hypothetical protein
VTPEREQLLLDAIALCMARAAVDRLLDESSSPKEKPPASSEDRRRNIQPQRSNPDASGEYSRTPASRAT